MNHQPTLLVLAAGMGSRYKGLKQIEKFGPSGETILEYSVYDAIRAGFGKVVFVIRKDIEQPFQEIFVKKLSRHIPVSYVFQELDHLPEGFTLPPDRVKPWGTGHAVMVASKAIQGPFAVINADDFYGQTSFQVMADFLKTTDNQGHDFCMVGYELNNTLSEFGFVSRGICEVSQENYLTSITERTQIARNEAGEVTYKGSDGTLVPLTGTEVASMNLMGFPASVFPHFKQNFTDFLQQAATDLKAEFFLPTVVNNLIHSGQARMKVLHTPEKWFGVTYQEDKEMAVGRLAELVTRGVYPGNLWG
jgi:dTDP-glucose pyrophosphorylase